MLKEKVKPIENFVAARLDRLNATPKFNKILLHGHCHQKALYGTSALHRIFEKLNTEVVEPDSGCCGMAGSFGYEKEHYDISQKLFERVLGAAIIEKKDLPVIASGFSCRHQVEHFAGKKAMHWLETHGNTECRLGNTEY